MAKHLVTNNMAKHIVTNNSSCKMCNIKMCTYYITKSVSSFFLKFGTLPLAINKQDLIDI